MVSIQELIDNLRATKPPYECPLCQKIYKSYSGIEYHLTKFKHDGSESPAIPSSATKRTKGRGRKTVKNKKPPPSPPTVSLVQQNLTYAQAQEIVEVELEGLPHRIHISDHLDVVDHEEIKEQEKTEEEFVSFSFKPLMKTKSKNKNKNKNKNKGDSESKRLKLPEAEFEQVDSSIRIPDAPSRPSAYFRFIEKCVEELDEMVEYDMDEEDYAWLDFINEQRKSDNIAPVSQEVFETLMDRLEKESYFESQSSCDPNTYIDEDAVCCICNDGECQNSNVILFCDMCNLAVHQECYGVPYIPEGQWLCRRCLQSPSRVVDCALCPNKVGAFKQTDQGKWAHVVCALWIPEVCFANTVFLEPIDSIENIPAARWKLNCYICKRRQGACIQCFKTNCYTAFHVTCAQQAGLYMKIEPVKGESGQITVRKTAYCDVHTPGNKDESECSEEEKEKAKKEKASSVNCSENEKTPFKSKKSIKNFRKMLAERKTTGIPIVNIPFIPAHRLSKIVSKVAMARKAQFVQNLQSYWMLKRQSRNGVPLLRRLQATHQSQKGNGDEDDRSERIRAMKEQLHFWQRLRHDLERARLLVELIRKREKLKREQVKVKQHVVDLQLQPLNLLLRKTLDHLQTKDPAEIFSEPVDTDEVPDYLDIVEYPMDFSTMKKRIDSNYYRTLEEFEQDFRRIFSNAMLYNAQDTVFYKAAVKLKEQGLPVVRAARRQVERAGIDPLTGLHTAEAPNIEPGSISDEDFVLSDEQKKELSLEEQYKDLVDKVEMTQAIKHGGARTSRLKMLKKEMALVRRKLNAERRNMSDSSAVSQESCQMQSRDHYTCAESEVLQLVKKRKAPPDQNEFNLELNTIIGSSRVEHKPLNDPNAISRATTNPSPGTSRRSGILFNKGRHRIKRNLCTNGETYSLLNNITQPESDQGLDIIATESEVTKNISTADQLNCSELSSISVKENARAGKRYRSESLNSNDGYFVPKKTYKTELGRLIEDATLPMYDTPSERLNSNHVQLNNGLRQRNYRTYTSGSESDVTDMRANGGRREWKQRKHSLLSEDELSTDTENSSAENKVINGPVSLLNSDFSTKKAAKRPRKATSDSEVNIADLPPLQPLDVVWAKCRGYPSYPALIINPNMPKKGLLHNGVPIPVPPDDVLSNHRAVNGELLYLVLFFDTRRTWQWLPRHKLELLGNEAVDEAKLFEGRKTATMRKSVQAAYERAIAHQSQVAAGHSIHMQDDEDSDGEYEEEEEDEDEEDDDVDDDNDDGVDDDDDGDDDGHHHLE